MLTESYKKTKKYFVYSVFLSAIVLSVINGNAQQAAADSLLQNATLPNVIQYALKRQPLIQQSLIDEKTTELQIKSKLADWYPQLNFNYLFQHNFQIQTTIIGGNAIKLGVDNTSVFQFTGSQTIFNRDVLLTGQKEMCACRHRSKHLTIKLKWW
jgi:outer membrane protein TolC